MSLTMISCAASILSVLLYYNKEDIATKKKIYVRKI